jgi:signal transduction histidine kinase
MVCYAIAILRYRLMDIDFVLNRGSVYAVVSGVMVAVYLISINILSAMYSGSENVIKVFSTIIVAILFAPIRNIVQDFIDKVFYQRRYNSRQTLLNLGKALSTILQLNELSDTLLDQLSDALQPEYAALMLREDSEYKVRHRHRYTGDEEKLQKSLIEFDPDSAKDRPERIGEKRLVMPLLSKGNCVGFILLGGKMSGKAYNAEDIFLMGILSSQAAISIENALIYEKLRDQVDFMQSAYNRMLDAFRKSYPDLQMEEPLPTAEDIISELDMIADALVRSSEMIRELDDLKSEFLSNVSHELRQPLTSIKGYADNLLDGVAGELNEKQVRYIKGISQNIERLIKMVSDMLNLTRIAAGRIELARTNFSLYPLIREVVFESSSAAEKKEISLDIQCPSYIKLLADQDKLKQVIINLVDNAIKFTPPAGKVSVLVRDMKESVSISVVDTGIGIALKNLDKIFNRWEQVPREDKGKSVGVGIGLSIVKSFVELHNGSISVESEPGKGSQFTFTIPKVPDNFQI